MDMHLVRFTSLEFDQLLALAPGKVFRHVNLQHYGVPYDVFEVKYCYAVKIKENGSLRNGINHPPIIDTAKIIQLELLNVYHSISVIDFNQNTRVKNNVYMILHNKKGVLESLVEKYSPVMGLAKEDFLNMECYVREFIVV